MEVTHIVSCDNNNCSNYGIECDCYSFEGNIIMTICGVCNTDITHTAVPITG